MSSQEEQREVLEKVAVQITRRRLGTVAIFALESIRPLTFLASQALVVLGPIVQSLLSLKEYDVLCDALENRGNIDWLIERLEREGNGRD